MKIIRASEKEWEKKPVGRRTKELFSHHFPKSVDSIAVYISYLSTGRLDTHYHTDSSEIIIFPKGGKITVNDVTYELNEWDAVLLEARETHGYNRDNCGDIIQLAIKFPAIKDKVSIKT